VIHADQKRLSFEAAGGKPSSLSVLSSCAGFLFSGRAIFVLISARWLNVGTEPGVLAGFAIESSLLVIALLAACGLNARSSRWIFRARPFKWVLLYIVFAGCSLLWSAAASPAASGLYWCGIAMDVVIVLLLARANGAACSASYLLKGFITGTCLLALLAWLMPAAQDLRLGDVDYFNTNQIANLCALAIFMCALLFCRGDSRWTIPAIFLGLTLLRSLSKATVIAFIAAQAYRLVSDSTMSLKRKWLLVSGAVVVTICFWGLLDSYFEIYTSEGNQAETFTGRTAIWIWALDAGLSRPFFGNGFDAMWKVAPPFGGEMFEARHAENEVLQQFFAYGLSGVALLIGVYGSLYRRFRSLTPGPEKSILISIMVFVVVRGLAEAEPFDLLLPLWLVVALIVLVGSDSIAQRDVSTLPGHLNGNSVFSAV
jgi:exopolysaccharide production protein ExoQ